MSHSLWVEKYRPKDLSTYIGNEHLKSKVKVYLESEDVPHLLLYGKAGTGKTTLAKIVVNNIDCDYMYINASDENKVDDVRNKIKTFASSVGFKSLKVIILDECDYLTPNAQAALRNLMETFSKHCRFILTCNYVERIIDPIQSRCQSYKVVPPSKKEVAIHTSNILNTEGVTYDNNDIVTMVNSSYPDIRRIINAVQSKILKKGGGHKMAAGFTIEESKIEEFREFIKKKFFKIQKNLIKTDNLFFDSKISPSALNEDFFLEINSLSPFGSGNPEPRFVIENLELLKSSVVGEKHIKALFSAPDGSVIKSVTFNAVKTNLETYLLSKKRKKIKK